jgi:glycosyltransferase involved in cell wall biosynthesis
MNQAPDMHILFLPKWYPTEQDLQFGVFIQKHAQSVSKYCRVSVVYPVPTGDPGKQGATTQIMDGQVMELRVLYWHNPPGTGLFGRIANIFRYYKAVRKGFNMALKERGHADLVHAHVLLRPGLFALMHKLRFGCPYILSEHWTGFVDGPYARKSRVYKFLCRIVVSQASAVSVVSEGLKKAMKSYALGSQHYQIVPNVIEISTKPVAMHGERDKVRILSVADLVDKNKNISGTLRVLEKIKQAGIPFEFHLVGGGMDEWRLKDLSAELGFQEEEVIFHGRQANEYVLNRLQESDFVIVNSNVETFSVFTAEAIASGKPVIATRCGGPEYFVNESNGILINCRDDGALEEAIRYMIKHFHQYDVMRMSEEINQRFNAETVGRQFYDLYLAVKDKSIR